MHTDPLHCDTMQIHCCPYTLYTFPATAVHMLYSLTLNAWHKRNVQAEYDLQHASFLLFCVPS